MKTKHELLEENNKILSQRISFSILTILVVAFISSKTLKLF